MRVNKANQKQTMVVTQVKKKLFHTSGNRSVQNNASALGTLLGSG